MIPSCRNCRHCAVVRSGTKLVCLWEKNMLPPPVVRKRLWGQDAPETWEEAASDCAHFTMKEMPPYEEID